MTKNHLKRLAIPQTWSIPRKAAKLVVRPRGYLNSALPVAIILKEILGVAESRRETKRIVQDGKVLVDGIVIKDERRPVTLMSIISITDAGTYRMLLNKRGKLYLKELNSKQEFKPCKVISKKSIKGNKIQLGFHDGRTIITDNKEGNLNDTFIFKVPDFKQSTHLKLAKKAKVYLTGGSNVGSTGVVENISGKVTVKIGETMVDTGLENIFMIDESIDVNE